MEFLELAEELSFDVLLRVLNVAFRVCVLGRWVGGWVGGWVSERVNQMGGSINQRHQGLKPPTHPL